MRPELLDEYRFELRIVALVRVSVARIVVIL